MTAQEFYIFAVSSLFQGRRMAEMSPQPLLTARGAVQAWGGMRAASARAPNPNPAPKTLSYLCGSEEDTHRGCFILFDSEKSVENLVRSHRRLK